MLSVVVDDTVDRAGPGDLVARVRAGDEAAFELLFLPLIGPAHRLAFALLRDHAAAEDAIQEACLSAWDRVGQLRSQESARSWFLAIVANRCRSTMRRRWWQVLKQPDPVPAETAEAPDAGLAVLSLRASVRRLPVNDQMILHLRFAEDLSHDEIARAVGVRVGTVKSRIHRALRRLRSELAEEGIER